MVLTATQFKNNFGEYLAMVYKEDIYITRNGKVIAKITDPTANRMRMTESLFGILPNTINIDEILAERLNKI